MRVLASPHSQPVLGFIRLFNFCRSDWVWNGISYFGFICISLITSELNIIPSFWNVEVPCSVKYLFKSITHFFFSYWDACLCVCVCVF